MPSFNKIHMLEREFIASQLREYIREGKVNQLGQNVRQYSSCPDTEIDQQKGSNVALGKV